MIKNARQRKRLAHEIEGLREFMLALQRQSSPENERFRKQQIAIASLGSLLESLYQDARVFDALTSGDMSVIQITRVEDLGPALIQARIGRGLTQSRLGLMLGVSRQQVQRWEHEEYENTSLARVAEVAEALGIGSATADSIPLGRRTVVRNLEQQAYSKAWESVLFGYSPKERQITGALGHGKIRTPVRYAAEASVVQVIKHGGHLHHSIDKPWDTKNGSIDSINQVIGIYREAVENSSGDWNVSQRLGHKEELFDSPVIPRVQSARTKALSQ